jgi:sec-independent protein translocase protein TatA
LILILVVALLVFGPRKLPELGRALGKGISEFRKATTDLKTTLEREISESEAAGGVPSAPGPSSKTPAPSSDSLPARGNDGADDPA